jgi:hypothetical protein
MTISHCRLLGKRVEKKKSPASGFVSLGYSGQGHDVTAPDLFGQPQAWRDWKRCLGLCEYVCAPREYAFGLERT